MHNIVFNYMYNIVFNYAESLKYTYCRSDAESESHALYETFSDVPNEQE